MPITAENARELQRKGVQKRQQNVQNLKAGCAKLPQLQAIAAAVASNSTSLQGEPFQLETLARVRKQIVLVQNAMDEAIRKGDSKVLRELTDSATRLGVWERELAGRPLPGSRRPKEDRRQSRQTVEPMAEPTAPEPRVDDPNEPNG